jgi:formylmethanofuran dehydrogenase subunit E
MTELQTLLDKSCESHSHLCPRQILGVRIGLAGAAALKLEPPQPEKRLLVILESDGCFADGVIAATGCTVGHRTLRVEDYGKVAATFVDTQNGQAVRVAPVLDARQKAWAYAPGETLHYSAQLQAYRIIPDEELLSIQPAQLAVPVEVIVSRPGVRANCECCGEEIINEREVHVDGQVLCRACAGQAYYHAGDPPAAQPDASLQRSIAQRSRFNRSNAYRRSSNRPGWRRS